MQRFRPAIPVAGDDGAGDIKNVLRAAVILLEQDRSRITVALLKAQHIAVIGAAEGIDRLVFIADDEDVVLGRGQQSHQLILYVVGILEFIDQHVFEAILIGSAQVVIIAQQQDHVQQQIIEIHGVASRSAACRLHRLA